MSKKSLTVVPNGSTEHRCMTLRLDEDRIELLLIPIERTAPIVELRLAPEDVAALREFLGVAPAAAERRERKGARAEATG